jgi:hypothetical protein
VGDRPFLISFDKKKQAVQLVYSALEPARNQSAVACNSAAAHNAPTQVWAQEETPRCNEVSPES